MAGLKLTKAEKKHAGLSVSHKHAPRQERETAKALGGKLTAGSGNKHEKGDIRIAGIARVECKSTIAKSFSITREMLTKLGAHAGARKEVPCFTVRFLDPVSGRVVDECAVVPLEALEALVEAGRRADPS